MYTEQFNREFDEFIEKLGGKDGGYAPIFDDGIIIEICQKYKHDIKCEYLTCYASFNQTMDCWEFDYDFYEGQQYCSCLGVYPISKMLDIYKKYLHHIR